MIGDNLMNVNTTASFQDKDVFVLPKFLGELEHITTVDTGGLEFVICCDKLKLFIFPLVQSGNKPLGTVHQSLPIPNIKSLRTIAKNFLMIETQNRYLGIFQIIKSPHKQPSDQPVNTSQPTTVKVEFSEVLKWRIFSSYFIRQVMQNLFQVQVFFTDLQFQIFHFTNKNKKGSMSFTISQNGRILKSNKRQLYGSKFFFNIGRKLVYWMKSFSDKQFFLQQIVTQQPMGSMRLEPFGYFGVQRAEQYKLLSTNLVIRDCLNPAKRHFLQIETDSFLNDLKAELATLSPSIKKKNNNQQQNPFHELVQRDGITQILESYKLTIFTDLIMIENKQKKKMEIYQIRTQGSSIVGKEDSHVPQDDISLTDVRRWQWYFGNSKKLIAIDRIGFKLKYVQEMTLRERNSQQVVLRESSQINVPTTKQEQKQSIVSSSVSEEIKSEVQKDNEKAYQQRSSSKSPENSQHQDDLKNLQGRKFSKDELKKYFEEFDENKSKEYIDKGLIKKVDQTNNKSSQKLPQNTSQQGISKQNQQKKSQENDSKEKTQILVEKQEKKQDLKSQPNISNIRKNSQIVNDMSGNQEQMKIKQKPPMKIIQKNKVSVAKSFISQQQSELKQQNGMKNESKIQEGQQKTSQPKDIEKPAKIPQEKQPMKQFEAKKQQIKAKQSHVEPKQERKKVNVITRATLLKKKQAQASKEVQESMTLSYSEQPKSQHLITQKQNKILLVEQIKTQVKQLKVETQKLQFVQHSEQKRVESILEYSEEKPKTRYIPSIDVKKVSVSQLNECEFLSEDSLSQEEEEKESQSKQQAMYKKSFQEDEQIEEQIEGESGYTSEQEEEDMEHLIDDDITKKDTPKKATQVVIKQQINHDEEIQKICNNLFEDRPCFSSYKKNSVYSSQNIVAPKASQLDKNDSKEQLNEINQLNSLLFKTNIKRTNIFGSEDKPLSEVKKEQIKMQERKSSGQNQTKEEERKQDEKTSQGEKKLVEEKKIKVWNDLSSDSDDEKSSSENQIDHKPQEANIQTKEQQNLPSEHLKISQTLQKLKKVESQCTKILSEIQNHKTKEIQQKILEQKVQISTKSVESITVKSQETKQIKYNPFIEDSKQKAETNIFDKKPSGLFQLNPFLASQGLSLPLDSASNWLFNKPSTQLTQNKDQNPFINFKKSLQDSQLNHHNLFGLGENPIKGEQNLFKNNFNEKLSKNQASKEESETNVIEPSNEPVKKQEQKLTQNNETQIKQSKQVPLPTSQFMIPTALLPKIQQLISSYQQSTLTLLQKQQSSIIKSLQQIPNTHNPYNKNHSLLLPEQIKEEIIKQSKNTVKKWLATKMLDKIQSSFKQIMQEHKKVYEEALKYYQSEAKRRITTMQLQYEQQQTILTDIQNVAANLSSALQGSVLQGEQMHTFQLKEWRNQISNIQSTLIEPLNQQIHDSKQFFTQRNKNLQNLGNELIEIKEILKNKLKKKQELKELKEKKKLKIQLKLKEEQEKKAKKIQQQGKKPNSKKVKIQSETPPPQYPLHHPPYGHYEPQYYGRTPPYPYY